LEAYEAPSGSTLSWVAAVCGGEGSVSESCTPLGGGTVANVDLVTVRDGTGRTFQVVLRRWADVARSLGRVEREVEALRALSTQEIRAPRLMAHDETGSDAGVRCVVMNKVSGSVVLQPTNLSEWISGLAEVQAEIHRVPPTLAADTPGWFELADDFSWISDPGLRQAGLAAAREAAIERVFVHGDYQQFNVVWERGKVSAVLDWTRTGTGTRGIDVGHTRLNLAALYSVEVANTYLNSYERAAGVSLDPRAELRSFLCWTPEWTRFSVPDEHLSTLRVDVNDMCVRVVEMVRSALRRLA
jgi:aminoglycoside phosphotransferase (APT) family kinase protein